MAYKKATYLLLFAASVLPYIFSLNYPFYYDDFDVIVQNVFIRDLNLKNIFAHSGARPVLFLTFALNYAVSGFETWSYRLVNIALHAFSSLCVLAIIYRLLKFKLEEEKARSIALGAAFIFAVHPALSQTVIYISSRSSGLAALMYFICILLFLAFRQAKNKRTKTAYYISLWAIFLPSLLIKEELATMPIVIFLLDYFWLETKKEPSGGKKAAKKSPIKQKFVLFIPHLPFWLLLAAGGTYRLLRLPAEMASSPLPRSVVDNLMTQANSIMRYIGLLFYPNRLSISHGYLFKIPDLDISFVLSIITICYLIITALILYKRYPIYSFGTLWFFITIAPSSSFFPLQENMADHRMYLPGIGVFIILAWAIYEASLLLPAYIKRLNSAKLFRASLIALVIALSALTLSRSFDWRDDLAIWGDAIRKNPDFWGSHYSMGDAYRSREMYREAIPHYFWVNALHGEDPDALINIGICFFEMGERDKAPLYWQKAIISIERMIQAGNTLPELPFIRDKAYNNLGRYALLKGEVELAKEYYAKTLAHNRGNVPALRGMGVISAEEGKYQEARRYFEEASWQLPHGSEERRELEGMAAEMAKKSALPLPPSNPYD